MADNPFEALADLFGGLFNLDGTPQPASTVEWDPLEAGHVTVRYADEPKPVMPGSVRQHLRNATTPRLTPVMDTVGHAAGAAAIYSTVNPGGAGAIAAAQGTADKKTRASPGKPGKWTQTNEQWKALGPFEKAAAMALMEADKEDPLNAGNALAAMINRAQQRKVDLGEHVSSRSYQPTFEPAQEKRLASTLKNPVHRDLAAWGERYANGQEDDPTGGATHFLSHPRVMLSLEASNPRKYRSWRGWTGFNPATGAYRNQTIADRSHAFLAPEGRYSVPRTYSK
jgi:hypothetical protein